MHAIVGKCFRGSLMLLAVAMTAPPSLAAGVESDGLAPSIAAAPGEAPAVAKRAAIKPDALLSVALNRTTVIEGIVTRWGAEMDRAGSGMTRDALVATLRSLRADQLLAASLAQTSNGLLDILDTSASAHAMSAKSSPKALGSTTQDLVFTPVVPCRLVDSRMTGPAWTPGIPRTYNGYTATDFTSQGGAASNCGIPDGVAALAIEAVAIAPPADGWFYLWPGNVPQPPSSTFNYGPALYAIAYGTILPVDGAASNQFKANSSQAAHLIVDVVGYFAPPALPAADHVMSYGPVDFIMAKNDGTALSCLFPNHNCSFPNGTTHLRFSLHIPGPATLTSVSCLLLDNDAGNITLELLNSSSSVASISTTANSPASQVLAMNNLNVPIGGFSRGPILHVTVSQSTTTMFLYECGATYKPSAY